MQQLTIRPDWSQDSQEERSNFIPPFQGLLTTMDNQAPPQAPQQYHLLEKTVPIIQGLKLLRLPPTQSPPALVREAWGPNQHKPTLNKISESFKRHAKPAAPPLEQSLHQYRTQTQAYTSSDRGRARQAVHLPPAPNVAVSHTRLPLLRLPPDIQTRPVQLPRIPLSAPIRLHTAGCVPMGSFPKPQLLRVEPEPCRTVSTTHCNLLKSFSIQSGWAKLTDFWIYCGAILVSHVRKTVRKWVCKQCKQYY